MAKRKSEQVEQLAVAEICEEQPTPEEIEYRTKLAECIIRETKARRDQVEFENKSRNLCRIDVALAEFDRHSTRHAEAWRGLADEIQAIVPDMSPAQYKRVQEYAARQMESLYADRLHLTLTTTEDERKVNREHVAAVRASQKSKAEGEP